MFRTIYLLGFLVIGPAFTGLGQNAIPAGTGNQLITAGYPEETVIHYNAPLLFSGEYLYYKLYNLNADNKRPSGISKIAYVELVAEDGRPVFSHKLDLQHGSGAGDFFIPTATPSGNYKLVGYTTWTLNNQNRPFFQGDITIINPYTNDQKQLLGSNEVNRATARRRGVTTGGATDFESTGPFNLEPGDTRYGPRKRVALSLSSSESAAIARLSVSVRLLDTVSKPAVDRFREYNRAGSRNRLTSPASAGTIFLPELRGEIISGKVQITDGSDRTFDNLQVALSIPGDNFLLKIVNIDRNGEFAVPLDQPYTGQTAQLEILGANADFYSIDLDQKPAIDYASLEFTPFSITPEMREMIRTRSIYNQIENAYYAVKPDTIIPAENRKPFYGNQITHYDLDAYTRFKTLRETFIEIIQFARITSSRGEARFEVRGLDPQSSGQPTLLIVDGQLVEDHDPIVHMEAPKIKSIGISRDRYFLGPQVFDGIVHIQTRTGDYSNPNSDATKFELLQSQSEKRYFSPNYDNQGNQDLERIPDFRHQLFWQPILEVKGNQEISFFTSDVTGDFIVEIAGFTDLGQPLLLKKIITVE